MEISAKNVQHELEQLATQDRAVSNSWFFKTGKGQYGYGDKFIGVTVPNLRLVSKKFRELPLNELKRLMLSPWHEERLCALFILVLKYQKGDQNTRVQAVDFYLANTKCVNNWDLVDSSAPYLLGNWLLEKPDRSILYDFAKSELLWERRIAIISTLEFIRNNQLDDTLKLAEILLGDPHDLINKAVGWSLREVGKKDQKLLIAFLDKHAGSMPRIALRYAIERQDYDTRQHYLNIKNN